MFLENKNKKCFLKPALKIFNQDNLSHKIINFFFLKIFWSKFRLRATFFMWRCVQDSCLPMTYITLYLQNIRGLIFTGVFNVHILTLRLHFSNSGGVVSMCRYLVLILLTLSCLLIARRMIGRIEQKKFGEHGS